MFYGSTPPCGTDERPRGMIFDQNRGSERSWTNIDPVGVTILLPSEDFVLLNHSTFKPFECYSDRLLGACPIKPQTSRIRMEQNRHIMFYAKGLPNVPAG